MKGAASGSTVAHAGPTRSTNASRHPQHHVPYRLEVCGITPVSISLLWSLRPLPLSAIPKSVVSGSVRQEKMSSLAAKRLQGAQARQSPIQRIQAAENSGGVGISSSITATRSPNRKFTKVSIRNVSPAQQRSRATKNSSPTVTARRDSSDWPSDDGATAVEDDDDDDDDAQHDVEDYDGHRGESIQGHPSFSAPDEDQVTPSEASEDAGHTPSHSLESGISVSVNGVPWSQVVVGDSGAEEVFIVVYGLHPAREYELMLSVDEKQSTMSVATSAHEVDEKAMADAVSNNSSLRRVSLPSPDVSSLPSVAVSSNQAPRIKRTHTPPMQDTETAPSASNDLPGDSSSAALSNAATTNSDEGSITVASLQAAMRKARKDASRAESALRNEIEAVKRGLERMSDVDHRSKQKLLALQENIRQATSQAKDIDEEATAVENERELWEEREKEKEQELEEIRSGVEEKCRIYRAQMRDDADEVETMEKELQQVTKQVEEKHATREKMEKEKLVEMEEHLRQMHAEIESTLARPPPVQPMAMPSASFYHAAAASQQQANQTTQHPNAQQFVPPHIHRGSGRGARGGAGGNNGGRGGGRGMHHQHHQISSGGGGRRNQHRHNARPAQGGQHHSSGGQQFAPDQDEHSVNTQQHNYQPYYDPAFGATPGGVLSPFTSVLNPHNPEFVPSGNATAQGSGNVSPIASRTGMLPAADQSPALPASRFPTAFASTHDEARRASTSHLDTSQLPSPKGQFANHSIASTSGSTTWLPGSGSPWAPTNTILAGSPQMGHDIWRSPASGPQALHSPNPASLHNGPPSTSPSLSLRTKTSIPFGLNASLLRGGANPSYIHSRLGDNGSPSTSSSLAPFDLASPGTRSAFPTSAISTTDDGLLRTQPEVGAGGGNSAPVSPSHAQPAEMAKNALADFPLP